jgi:hypothetical protein
MNARPCRGGTRIVATGFVPPLQGCILFVKPTQGFTPGYYISHLQRSNAASCPGSPAVGILGLSIQLPPVFEKHSPP